VLLDHLHEAQSKRSAQQKYRHGGRKHEAAGDQTEELALAGLHVVHQVGACPEVVEVVLVDSGVVCGQTALPKVEDGHHEATQVGGYGLNDEVLEHGVAHVLLPARVDFPRGIHDKRD